VSEGDRVVLVVWCSLGARVSGADLLEVCRGSQTLHEPTPEGDQPHGVVGMGEGSGLMARSPRQDANLRRGGAPATPDSARRAREAKARHETEDEEARERAKVDPTAAILELVGDLAVGVRKLMRKWLATGGEPPKVLIDALREFRQASRDAVEYLGGSGGGRGS
jgi:hypothetical protein